MNDKKFVVEDEHRLASEMSKATLGNGEGVMALGRVRSAPDPCSSTLFSHLLRSAIVPTTEGSWGIEMWSAAQVQAPVCGAHPPRGQRLMAHSGEELIASGGEHCSLNDGHPGGHANKAIGRCGVWWSTLPDPFQCAACGGHVGPDLDEHAHLVVSKESAMSSGKYEHERATVCGPCSKLSPQEREKKAMGQRVTYKVVGLSSEENDRLTRELNTKGFVVLPWGTKAAIEGIGPVREVASALHTLDRVIKMENGVTTVTIAKPGCLPKKQEPATFQALAEELAADVPGICSAVRWKAIVNVMLADIADRARGKLTLSARRVAQQEVNGLRDVMPFYATRRFVHRYSHAEALRDTMQAHEGYATRDLARICLAYDRAE